jgi:hypothetical protein
MGSADYRSRLSEAMDGAGRLMGETGRRAPGDVQIKEGPPHLGPAGPVPHDGHASPGGARHSPSVQDFPPHAQREYWAKTAEADPRAPSQPRTAYQRQPEPAPAKTSLLRRLAGAGRNRPEGGDDQLQKHSQSRSDVRAAEEQVDLPVFFGRGKR